MATFTPGHLHIERHALNKEDFSYNLYIDYEVAQDPKDGTGMRFTLHGTIEGQSLNEPFFMPKDQAFDFARVASHIAQKYGMPKNASIISLHKYYDEMFEDVRAKLDVKSGDPINFEHMG